MQELEQSLISIIVPVYNTAAYLPRCVEALRGQTYRNLEILLVDDGSEDESGELCDAFAKADGRIRVFHKENGGSSSARNLGIEKARGEYLGFVDSDDFVDSRMYELLYRALTSFHAKVAQVGRDELDPQGGRLPDICVPPQEATAVSPEEFMRELLMHRGDCSFCTKLFVRDVLNGEGFPEGGLNEDFHFLVKLLGKTGDIISLPQQCYHVFYRVGSNSRKEDKENFSRVFADSVVNADMVAGLVERDYPGLKREAFRFGIFQRLEYLLHIPISQMNGENEFHRDVVRFLRKNWVRAMGNPFLTPKNKLYHTLFAIAPKKVRQVHSYLRGKNYR